MTQKLSKRQEQILTCIQQFVKDKGFPPTVREIGEVVGLASSSTVHGHLERLEKRGYIRRDPTKPRAQQILINMEEVNDEPKMIPLLGKVTAGEPITAIENIEGYYPLPSEFQNEENVFMLEVAGDSMIEAGIFNGDYVYISRQSHSKNGDIVLALTEEGEATIKYFHLEKGKVVLKPANCTMKPFVFSVVMILGKVIGTFRIFK